MSLTDLSTHETDLMSQQAEIFRSKLITDFHLLETISEGGRRREVPNLYTQDITDKMKMHKIMLTRPQSLVRFHIYHKQKGVASSSMERRRNRLKNKNKRNPPIDLWANWVISSSWFQNFILALILINSVVLGIQAEESEDSNEVFVLVLDIFDYCALLCFVVEIVLKWLDNFKDFWKNRWNIFDFFVTFLSFVPEIIKYSTGGSAGGATSDLTVVADNLRTFRVLRSLKMVSRFQKVRLIVLAVTKAFQAMIFITLLLFIFAYIFAIIGVIFFDYSAHRDELIYQNSFSSILNALITLFQLFTLDHWLDIFKDVRTVAGQGFAAMYVILWIIIGSFIIRNIVVGIMVNNFQSIRNELFEEVGEIHDREKRDIQMAEFAEELDRQTQLRKGDLGDEVSDEVEYAVGAAVETLGATAGTSEMTSDTAGVTGGSTSDTAGVMASDKPEDSKQDLHASGFQIHQVQSRYQSGEELKDAMEQNVSQAERESEEWQTIVERNLENLAKEEATFCWPQDSLFRYFLMLESLQENLKERQELLGLACDSLMLIHDT